MSGLLMKYFVLNPRSKTKRDPYAKASRAAMQTYAEAIREENQQLYDDLKTWVVNTVADDVLRFGDQEQRAVPGKGNMKASELEKKDLSDGDTIVLESDIENVINRCCGCGMLHHIKIKRSENGVIRMTWKRIEGDPEIESPREVIIEEATQPLQPTTKG